MKENNVYDGALMPSLIVTFWQFTGLRPCPIRIPLDSRYHCLARWLLPVWTVLIFLLYGYFYAIEVVVFSTTYRSDLIELEFFTLILLVYREYFFLLPLFYLLVFTIKRQTIARLARIVEVSIADMLEISQVHTVRAFHYIAWAVLFSVAAGSAYCSYAGFRLMLELSRTNNTLIGAPVTWSSLQPLSIFPGKRHSC